MKMTLFLLVVATLLASCQSGPTVIETPMTSVDLFRGIWYQPDGYFWQFLEPTTSTDATFYVYKTGTQPWAKVDSGTYKFEDGKLTYLAMDKSCQDAQQATYEISTIKHDGKFVGMKPKLVGTDACANRQKMLNGKFIKYLGSVAISVPEKTEERLVKSGAELLGIGWQNETVITEFTGEVDAKTGNADLKYYVYYPFADPWELVDSGSARFEDGKVTYLTSSSLCAGIQATYEQYVIKAYGKPVASRQKLLGEDPCQGRRESSDGVVTLTVTP